MQYLPGQLAQLEVDDEANRRRQAMAQSLQQAGFNPVQGGNPLLAILSSVMSTVQGGRMMKESDAKASEIMAKRFELENQKAQQEAEAAQRRRDEDYQRDLQKIDYTNQSGAKYREPKEQSLEEKLFNMLPENLRGQAALGKFGLGPKAGPGPSESDRKIEQLRALGATDDQIRSMLLGNTGGSAPSGYRPTADGALEPIPGGPADPAAQANKPRILPADMAGKVALAEEYMANAPSINEAIKSGALTGIFDQATARSGYGEGGKVFRKIQSGRDALQRTLTGAGMPASEAGEYADRYLPTAGDTAETLLSKQEQLQAELGRFTSEARGQPPAAPSAPPAPKQPQGAGPSFEQFLEAARAANPGVSDAELKTYYANKYGAR